MPAIFNKEQEEAITHKEGPLMVLAGPGSGKTLVITYRVKCGGTSIEYISYYIYKGSGRRNEKAFFCL